MECAMHFWMLLVVAGLLSAWLGFGDEAVAEEGGDEGASEGGADQESGGDFETAAKAAGLDPKYVEIFNRHVKKSAKAEEAEAKARAAEAKATELETGRDARRRDRLVEQALEQEFSRSEVERFLEEGGTLDELNEKLKEDRAETRRKAKGGAPKASTNAEGASETDSDLKKRVEAMERSQRERDENESLRNQMVTSMKEFASDLDNEDQALVAGIVEQEIELARARHQKLPNVKSAIKNAAKRIKDSHGRATAKLEKEGKDAGARLSEAKESKARFKKKLNAESNGVQEMVKLMTGEA
jgi:hypothetical protein